VSGALKVTVRLDVSGPLADGTAEKLTEDWQRNTTQALADKGVELLREFPMNKTGRARGGFQESLHIVRKSAGAVRIPGPQEKGVVWASWLEGTSKRNRSTKFKGYHLFKQTRAELDDRAEEIGQQELDKLIGGMGGE
jgi:hypothetical protein